MTTRLGSVTRLLRSALVLVLLVRGADAHVDVRARVQGLLGEPCDAWRDVPALQGALAELGAAAVPALFEAYAGHAVDHPVLGVVGLGRKRSVAVEGALERLGRPAVLAHLETVARDGSVREREGGLRLARKLATPGDLDLVADLAAPRHAEVEDVLDDAWIAVLEVLHARDPGVVQVLGRSLSTLPRPLRVDTVRFVGGRATPAAFHALLDTVGRTNGVEDLVLLEILVGVRRGLRPGDWELAKLTSEASAASPQGRALLAHVFAVLRDPRTVPELLVMVAEGPTIAEPAAAALRRIAVLNLPADPTRWRAWHDREQAWYGARWSKCLHVLGHGDFAEAAEALRELTTHPLFARELANELDPVLTGDDGPLAVLACSALAHLRVRGKEEVLVGLLRRDDPEVRASAAAALRSITGEDFELDHARWRAWLEVAR